MIVWIDPAVENVNAGDEVISESIAEVLGPALEDAPRLTSHRPLRPSELTLVANASVVLFGGTNVIHSHAWRNRQWPLPPWQVALMRAKVVFFGVGWWQYQEAPDALTKRLYRFISHPDLPHAARDSYTHERLLSIGLRSVMTSCPTIWGIPANKPNVGASLSRDVAVTTITDYYFREAQDRKWLSAVAQQFRKVVVVGMGPGDETAFKKLADDLDLHWGGYGREALRRWRDLSDIYIGTRLHGGIYWRRHGGRAMVIAVDNRTREIGKDVNLQYVDRGDLDGLVTWMDNPREEPLHLPQGAIDRWLANWYQYTSAP